METNRGLVVVVGLGFIVWGLALLILDGDLGRRPVEPFRGPRPVTLRQTQPIADEHSRETFELRGVWRTRSRLDGTFAAEVVLGPVLWYLFRSSLVLGVLLSVLAVTVLIALDVWLRRRKPENL